jgi:hypothetical protein
MSAFCMAISAYYFIRPLLYVSLVVSSSRSFPHSWLITGFVNRLTRRVRLVEQELIPFRSTPVFSGVLVSRSLVLYVCFGDRCLSFCTFFFWSLFCLLFFDLRILITPLISSDIWPLYCLYFFDLRILITPLVSSDIWPLCCLFFDLRILITPLVSSDIWPLCCLIFFDLRILITPLVSLDSSYANSSLLTVRLFTFPFTNTYVPLLNIESRQSPFVVLLIL